MVVIIRVIKIIILEWKSQKMARIIGDFHCPIYSFTLFDLYINKTHDQTNKLIHTCLF